MTVKIRDGATYMIAKRSHPDAAQRTYYWLGDNGQELETKRPLISSKGSLDPIIGTATPITALTAEI